MTSSIKAIIFDMGGVILRTVDASRRETMACRLGTTREELEQKLFLSETSIQSEIGQLSETAHWEAVLEHYGQPPEKMREMYMEFFAGDEIDLQLLDFIASLKPRYKVGLLSNAWMNARQNITQLHDFMDLFDVSIFSAEVGMRKPDARVFNLVLERLGVRAEEAVFVDDFPNNIAAAAAVGLRTVLFRGRQAVIDELNQILAG